jgi:hypothetical protein
MGMGKLTFAPNIRTAQNYIYRDILVGLNNYVNPAICRSEEINSKQRKWKKGRKKRWKGREKFMNSTNDCYRKESSYVFPFYQTYRLQCLVQTMSFGRVQTEYIGL